MKNTLIGLLITALLVTVVVGFAACTSSTETATTESSEKSTMNDHDMSNMNAADMANMDHGDTDGKEHMPTDYSAYKKGETEAIAVAAESIDKALVEKNKDKAIEGAKSLIAAFEKFDASKLEEGKKKEYDEIVESAKEHAEHIIKSELKHQVEHNEGLVKDLKDLFALVGETKSSN